MSSFSSVCKTTHVSPPSREHSRDPVGLILSQGRCLAHDQGQTLGSELGLMEMTEVEYAHLQHFLQAHMEAQAGPPDWPDARPHPASVMVKDAPVSTVASPSTATQAIDLSTSSDDHCLEMVGEKTPPCYAEVPGFVLARIRGEESPAEPPAKVGTSPPKRSRSAARVCLEKRFNTVSADDTRQQDIQSAVLTNFLTILQQSSEAQEAAIHPPTQKWVKTDRANPFEISSSFVSGVFDPVTNMCGKVIAHMVDPAKHHGLILPSFSFNFHPETAAVKVHCTGGSNPAEEHQLANTGKDVVTAVASRNQCSTHYSRPAKAAKVAPDSARESQSRARIRAQSCMTLSQRKERHNSKERERRKRIRLCCDELNTMVPFCDSDTDKVTTLQWTTAFLRYINKTYGDTFKEEFQKVFTHEKGHILKSNSSSDQDHISKEIDLTISLPLAAEQ